MSKAVAVTVAWTIKPERADAFVEALRGMFPTTRLREGFRTIRLLRSDGDPNQFLLTEEWDDAQNFHDYVQFRTDSGDTATLLDMIAAPPQVSIWALDALASAQV